MSLCTPVPIALPPIRRSPPPSLTRATALTNRKLLGPFGWLRRARVAFGSRFVQGMGIVL
jgi:hypothetical protein